MSGDSPVAPASKHAESSSLFATVLDGDVASATGELKQALSRRLERLASAARSAGREAGEEDPELGAHIDGFAEALAEFSGYLSRNEIADIVADVQDQLRARPALLLGGALLAGLAVSSAVRALTTEVSQPPAKPPHNRTSPPVTAASLSRDAGACHSNMAPAAPFPSAHKPQTMKAPPNRTDSRGTE